MNMILKKRLESRGGRRGFTLVEVIVVLVILAILAAIAIPALTGYIDKANDKKYIADARNAEVAVRAVLDETYADGTLTSATPASITYITDGLANPWGSAANLKLFEVWKLSQYATGDRSAYFQRAAELMGVDEPADWTHPGFWEIFFITAASSSYTALDAPIFFYRYFPEGVHESSPWVQSNSDKDPLVAVFYGVDITVAEDSTWNQVIAALNALPATAFDPSVGYRVFHLTY
jgi:prepilin-type N-terminal cleavage/methylation domain-containing protein